MISDRYKYGHTHDGVFFSPNKEENPAIYDDMDGAEGHYAKQN